MKKIVQFGWPMWWAEKDEGNSSLLHDEFQSGRPFRHLVMDSFLDRDWIQVVEQSFPHPREEAWYRYDNLFEKKLALPHRERMPSVIQDLLSFLTSSNFVNFLKAVSGIPSLIPDPHFYGGGLHQIEAGGKLDIHADFNRHPGTSWWRRLNLILYLNSDWADSYGGHLEFWDPEMRACQKQILPISNRAVIFESHDTTFHGHPEPLKCPGNRTRKSIASYYYSEEPHEILITPPHSTLYQRRPDDPQDEAIEALRKRRALGRLREITE